MIIKGTHAYPKIYALGSPEVADILKYPVTITEKIDGSQIGFGIVNGELYIRSKGSLLSLDNPTGLFKDAVAYIRSIKSLLDDRCFYYGECLQSKRHNKLNYERVPRHNIALYGCFYASKLWGENYTLPECWGTQREVDVEANRLEIDCVPILYEGLITPEKLEEILSIKKSFLGGEIEGVVIKSRYRMLGQREPFMQAKLVCESFREVKHKKAYRIKSDNKVEEGIEELFQSYRTEARWDKAIQHLRESGTLSGSSRDIGILIKEIHKDILEEEGETIKELVWQLFKKRFLSTVIDGFPAYYQKMLMEQTQRNEIKSKED